MLRRLALCCAAVALLAAPTAFAQGSTRDKILAECEAGELRGNYTAKQLRDARNNIPGDLRQYTDCEETIDRALTGLGGGGSSRGPATPPAAPAAPSEGGGTAPVPTPDAGAVGGTSASGGSERRRRPRKATTLDPSGPEEQQALSEAAADPGPPVRLDEGAISPGAVGLTSSSIRQDLPRPVLAVLALLALGALAALVPGARRLLARRR